ncbi:MAG: hypothetical protein ABI539_15300 [Acidobacteriota bacterium]
MLQKAKVVARRAAAEGEDAVGELGDAAASGEIAKLDRGGIRSNAISVA